jgi:DNA-binding IclR family transcriptional regulator
VCFAMAVPLTDPPTDAISLSVPVPRVVPDTEERIATALRRAMSQIRAARSMFS